MINKKYLNISEVSKMLQIEEHKIRYWDPWIPKLINTELKVFRQKQRWNRYFNKDNIKKLQKLKNILYDGDNQNYSIKLAGKILTSKIKSDIKKDKTIMITRSK